VLAAKDDEQEDFLVLWREQNVDTSAIIPKVLQHFYRDGQ
jgi:hypothetical protein